VNVLEGTVEAGVIQVGSLRIPTAAKLPPAGRVRVAVRMGDVRLWIDEPGIATVTRVADVGDRLKVEASIDGAGGIIAHVPRFGIAASELATGVRVTIDAARHRAYALSG
jgi:sulfate transport system ATP-binding protein